MTPKRDSQRSDAIQRQIDENLRRVYEQDKQEEIPERFLSLLEKLREQE
ncbi:NepR family anti-sigma factor [Paracoccus homiensis]|uniref:Anti-sigma factor NepR domain-containing protein n=1 Tax=Paracoccus homiensis TaxID=364199 RepID=A0A1I0AV14_9RHOB|nr:NepR family anti-sigma factor [Paracoccus homiensis]SES98226.1 hypothetical protein SAMN04489858_102369 [Paracoccus homiensis]